MTKEFIPDSDDITKEHISDGELEPEYTLSEYVLNLLILTNECRIWAKRGDRENLIEDLQRMDELLIQMRYGKWVMIERETKDL